MHNTQQLLTKLKMLCLKNKGQLEDYSNFISNREFKVQPQLANFPQIKQQYQLILTASKQSIDRNTQLHQQLESKQEYVRNLKEKLNRHSRQLEDLNNQVAKANGNLKKQRKSRRDFITSQDLNQKLKKDIQKANKKKNELNHEFEQLNRKQQQLKGKISQITAETLQHQMKLEKQESRSQKRIEQLLKEIKMYRQNANEEKIMSSSRVVTPQKSAQKKKGFAQIQLMIKQQKQREFL